MTTAAQKAKAVADAQALLALTNALQADAAAPAPAPTPAPAPAPTPAPAPAPAPGAPTLLRIDCLTGPVGCILSVFGENYAADARVFIGTVEATVVQRGAAANAAKINNEQMLRVVVPTLPAGAQAVKVVSGGVATVEAHTFTQCAGRILYVSLTGNDATAVPGDVNKPYRHMQTPDRAAGAYSVLRAGDHIIVRGGAWSDLGFETAWMRFRDPTAKGTLDQWIHVTGAPNEDVHYTTPAGAKGGIHGPASAYAGTCGEYISISCLRMDVNANASSDAAPINLQSSFGNVRVVNCTLGPWPSAINSKAAGVAGHGTNVKVLGNHIYGMACTGAQENHGVYADSGASNWEIASNYIHDITGGNLIQFFDNLGAAGQNQNGLPPNWNGFVGMQVHHNWLETSGKYGLNLSVGTTTGEVWANVIKGAAYAGIRVDVISRGMAMKVYRNVFYDNDRVVSGSGNAQVLNTWGNYGPTGTFDHYNNLFGMGPNTTANSAFYANVGDSDAYLTMHANTYYANGHPAPKPTKDATGTLIAGAMPAALLAVPAGLQ